MSSGWGCQYLSRHKDEAEWCTLLKHKCEPGCKGCVLYSAGVFSEAKPNFDEGKKAKSRSDNPLGKR